MRGVTVRDRAAFVEGSESLVVADVHVGRDESSSVAFPLGERSDLLERLEALLAHFDPAEVVFAGDVVHTFDGVSAGSAALVRELTGCCRGRGSRPVLVAGNHDAAFAATWEEDVREEYLLESAAETRTVVCHGHARPSTAADRYVIGHDHPVIEIEGARYPCFLYGPGAYRGADVLQLPAFNRLAPGVVVNDRRGDDFASPLVADPDVFEPIVYDPDTQETLRFPPLGELRRLL